jgi:uncharacterized repeat protein (TIGR02543 family)
MAVKKKNSRRLKKQVRKTLGAVFLASAVAVAAIPTGSMEGGNATAAISLGEDGKQVYTHTVKSGYYSGTDTANHSEIYPITSTATAHSVFVNTLNVSASSPTIAASSGIPICDDSTTIYSTGDGDFQFAYVTDKGSQSAAGDKYAVILGYSHKGAIENNTVEIPDTFDAYLNYNDNNGSGSGFVAVGKSANYLFYVTEEKTSYYTIEDTTETVTKKDSSGAELYIVNGDTANLLTQDEIDRKVALYNSGDTINGLAPGYSQRYATEEQTAQKYTYYSPCFYSKISEWSGEDTVLYYYPTDTYRPEGNANASATKDKYGNIIPVSTTGNQTYERISNAKVIYIGCQYLESKNNGWTIAGKIESSDNGIFAGNSNISTLIVGKNLSGIGDYAFYGCTNLKEITLDNGLKTIGNHAFDSCKNMNTINLPDECNINAIGAYAFNDCEAFTSFTVPNSVASIGDGAFKNCYNLQSINLTGKGNGSITHMGSYVFQNCGNLTGITFPRGYSETIELSMFEGCSSLQYIRSENSQFSIVPSTTCDFDWEAFKLGVTEKFYIESPDNSTMHKTCTTNQVSFKYLDQDLYELTKEEEGTGADGSSKPTVTYLVDSSCTLLDPQFNGTVTSLTFPEYIGPYSIKHIGTEAFKDHCTLTEMTIASTVESIGDRAFQGCHNLKYVYFKTDSVSIGSMAFQTQEVTKHDSKCKNSTDMTDTDNSPKVKLHFVGTVGSSSTAYNYAMSYDGRYNTGSQSLSFIEYLSGWPTCLTIQYNYDKATGKGYSELVDFPTLTDLADYAKAEYLTTEQKAAASGALANMNNDKVNLTDDQVTFINAANSLTIPKGVDAIQDGLALRKTDSLTTSDFKVYCYGLNTIETGYETDTNGNVELDSDGFKTVVPEESDFAGCTKISEIYLYGDTTTITEGAFTGDTALTTVNISGNTVSIGNHAFKGCTELKNVSISPTVETLGISPFIGCDKLMSVNFQNSENFVCDNSIIYGLTNGVKTRIVELLKGRSSRVNAENDSLSTVTDIEPEAFADTNVRSIDLKAAHATVIPERAFADTVSLNDVTLPSAATASEVSIGNDAFRGSHVTEISGAQNVNLIETRGTDGIVVGTDEETDNNNTVNNNKVTIYAPEGSYLYKYAIAYDFKVETVTPVYSYTVTFRDWNEELGKNVDVDTQTVGRGEAAVAPTPAGKEGYIFGGWDNDFEEVYGDTVVTAVYNTPPEGYGKHLVTYYDYDDTVYATEYVSDGADAAMSFKEPTRTGYTFTGWRGKLTNITEDTTVYAEYNEGYLLRYFYYDDAGEKQLFYSMYVADGESGPTLDAPVTKAGYSFTGWLPATTDIHEPTDTYAQYLPDGSTGIYTVNYYSYDGSLIDTYSVIEGGNAPNISGPVREGYTFTGWLPSLTNVTSDRDVVATYTVNTTAGDSTSGSGSGSGSNGSSGDSSGSSSGGSSGGGTAATTSYYVLTVVNGSGSGSYIAGSQPIIVADDPASGQEFSSWSVEPSSTTMASKALSATVVTMPSENVTVTANYKAKSGSSSGSGTTGSSNSTRVPATTGTIKSGGTTVVIDKNGLSNTGVVSATVNGSSDNFTIKVSESSSASESAVKALMSEYGDLNSIKYFPMDITLYDSTGQNKITDTTGLSITITLPLPDSLAQYAGNNKIASVVNDKLEKLTPKFTTISGVPCITFTAEHFSPYVIYVDTNNLTAGTMSDSTPKTGDGIHPKWFVSIGLACISVVLFMKKDKKTTKKGLVKA